MSENKPNPEFLEQREKYGADYSKTVVPLQELMIKFVGFGVEYGKVTISYLFLINAGGLAGIVALYPLVRQGNQVWLYKAMLPAVLFGAGLLLVTVSAAVAYVNFNYNATTFLARATDDNNWLKYWHFGIHKPTAEEFSKINQRVIQRALRLSTRTVWLSQTFAILSVCCGVAGGITLLISLLPGDLI